MFLHRAGIPLREEFLLARIGCKPFLPSSAARRQLHPRVPSGIDGNAQPLELLPELGIRRQPFGYEAMLARYSTIN